MDSICVRLVTSYSCIVSRSRIMKFESNLSLAMHVTFKESLSSSSEHGHDPVGSCYTNLKVSRLY